MDFADFDTDLCVQEIHRLGIVSIPSFLAESDRMSLLSELKDYELIAQPTEKGRYQVRQDFSSVSVFPERSLFLKTASLLEELLQRKFEKYLFKPLRFTDLVVQKYEKGSLGISPHRDGAKHINLIAILILEGKARFGICDDREGNNARSIPNSPGSLLLMRGVGFLGSVVQPFHFVDGTESRRITFALRQY